MGLAHWGWNPYGILIYTHREFERLGKLLVVESYLQLHLEYQVLNKCGSILVDEVVCFQWFSGNIGVQERYSPTTQWTKCSHVVPSRLECANCKVN